MTTEKGWEAAVHLARRDWGLAGDVGAEELLLLSAYLVALSASAWCVQTAAPLLALPRAV